METHVFDRPHRRLNPLTGDYVLVSPQRTLRPWQGQIERAAAEVAASAGDGGPTGSVGGEAEGGE